MHARVAVPINWALTLISFVLLFCGDVSVHRTNFTKSFREDVLLKHLMLEAAALNYSNPLTLSDVREFFDDSHPGHALFTNESNYLHIKYGETWENWCWNDPPLNAGIPSVLRLLEFHSPSQTLLRFTFLISLCLRPILTYAQSLTVMDQLKNGFGKGVISPTVSGVPHPPSHLVFTLLYASPPLQFLSTLSGSLVLMWQQDKDFHDMLWVTYYTFALFYFLHMVVYTSIELLEPRRMNTARVVTRTLLIICFCWTVSPTLQRQMEFLNRKTCHVNVPIADALCEYSILIVITLFSLLEWTDFWNLQVTYIENPRSNSDDTWENRDPRGR